MSKGNSVEGMRFVVIGIVVIDGKSFPAGGEGIANPAIRRGRNRPILANIGWAEHVGLEQGIYFAACRETLRVRGSVQYLPRFQLSRNGLLALFAIGRDTLEQERVVLKLHSALDGRCKDERCLIGNLQLLPQFFHGLRCDLPALHGHSVWYPLIFRLWRARRW